MGDTTPGVARPSWTRRTGWIIFMLVFVFPVGLVLMWKNARWPIWIKAVLSGFAALIVVASASSPKTPHTTLTTSSPQSSSSTANAPEKGVTPAAVAIASPSPEPSRAPSTSPTIAPPPPTKAPPAPVAAADHKILTISGTGNMTSQEFDIPADDWTVNWNTGGGSSSSFGFFAYPAGDTTSYVGSADSSTPGPGTTTVHQGNGKFYLKILSANSKWTVSIVANYAGADHPATPPAMATVSQFSGSGDQDSPTFQVTGGHWRVHLHIGGGASASAGFFVYPKGETQSYAGDGDVNGDQGGTDVVSYIEAPPGGYYIKLLAANTSWTMTVEQGS
ncbi:MAG: hypothetical protein ACYDGR_01595 [Candidatus Dormibacteria bacterium]